MELKKEGNRIYLDDCLYLTRYYNGEYGVYDDGEYQGKYCGSIDRLEEMSSEEAVKYVLRGI